MKKIVLLTVLIVYATIMPGQIIHVPADKPTIQAGIDAASDGDTVLVANGTYLENINFNGKAITVAGNYLFSGDTNDINNTIIDGSQPDDPDYGSTVSFVTSEDTTSILCGLTITGGSGTIIEAYDMRIGGGVLILYSGAKLLNNKIINSEIIYTGYGGGGGVACYSTSSDEWLIARNNIIAGNYCESSGMVAFSGGIYCAANMILQSNKINDNQIVGLSNAEANGCGVMFEEQMGTMLVFDVQNNKIKDNSAEGKFISGVGMCFLNGEGKVTGNIIENNTGNAISQSMGGGLRFLGLTGKTYITDNEIRNNSLTSEKSQGAGIDVGLAEDKVFIQNNTIEYNNLSSSYASWGAGISFVLDNELLIENNRVSFNNTQATQFCPGAGLYCERASGLVEFKNNYLSYNSGTGTSLGGGIAYHNTFGNKVVFDGNVFEYNENRLGGGIWTYNSFDMVISNNIFRKNTVSMNGGGLMLRFNPGDEMEFASTRLHGRDPHQEMEPVRLTGEHPLIINNTFVENDAVWGGGIYTEHQSEFPLIVNSIFWNNTADRGDEIYHSGPDSLLISYCDLDTSPDSAIYGKWRGDNNIFTDPGFCDTTCHIDQYSSCIDIGIDSLEFNEVSYHAPNVDIDGNVRPYGEGGIDLGGDECDIFVKVPIHEVQSSKFQVQNYPNPFSDHTTIEFTLPEECKVSLKVYDLTGREIETVFSEKLEKGDHTYTLQAGNLQSGIYLYRLSASNEVMTGKLVVRNVK